ncbi:MAG: hypothetical protein ACLQBA_25595 [Candidatus Binataceae bacterium]
MKRQPDGTWRGTRQAIVVSDTGLRARWIESEVIGLKKMGLSFDTIAEQIGRAGRRETSALTALPEGVAFPAEFKISRQAAHKAFKRAIAREPALELEEFRKLDTARCDEMFMNLQPSIRKGNVRAVEAGIKVLGHSARINGYAAPQRHELTGKDGKPLTLVQLLEAVGPISDEDKNSNELTAQQKAFVREIVGDPVLFAEHVLGVDLWDLEADILRSISAQRRTAIKACHGVGKTFTLSLAALWWRAIKRASSSPLRPSNARYGPSCGRKSIGRSSGPECPIQSSRPPSSSFAMTTISRSGSRRTKRRTSKATTANMC